MAVTVWILGDQLLRDHPAVKLAEVKNNRDQIVVLMIESDARARRIPYQSKKLVLLFSAMRHYARRLRSSGYQVDYRISPTTTDAIMEHIQLHHPEELLMMAASEYSGRSFQQNLENCLNIPVTIVPNSQFLVGRYDPYSEPQPGKRYIQEGFYRRMRQHFDLLIEANGEPRGGQWNFDKENRRRLPKGERSTPPIAFEPDAITFEVMAEVDRKFPGVGQVQGFDLAVTHEDAQAAAEDFFKLRLRDFGAYEDAMSSEYDTIYHSKLSPYLNTGLLEPLSLAKEAERRLDDDQAPLNSVEGFVRQVVGWREYIYWQYWRLMPGLSESNYWGATRSLPNFFWDGNTNLNCLSRVIARALRDGYTHHIERLMVLSNFCLLVGIKPDEVNEWFLSVYIDAYEWVMLPNVFGMGLYADGGQVGTKPYISSANYINKMSDYCLSCSFNQKLRTGEGACPYNYLYWNFMLEHEERLRSNPRMGRSLLGLRHIDQKERLQILEQANEFLGRIE
jgi:deoxyribodipyrimidine photolyase-related protein